MPSSFGFIVKLILYIYRSLIYTYAVLVIHIFVCCQILACHPMILYLWILLYFSDIDLCFVNLVVCILPNIKNHTNTNAIFKLW